MGAQQIEYRSGILVHDQSTADLGVGMRWDDGLAAIAVETAPQAVDVQGWTRATSLEHGEVRFANEGQNAHRLTVGLLVEGQIGERRAVSLGQGHDVVVETGDLDDPIRAFQAGEDPGQRIGRVLDGPSITTRMEVDRRPEHVDLRVHNAAQGDRDCRQVPLEESRIADDRDVCFELASVRLEPGIEAWRTGLLVAFEHELEVQRKTAARRQECLGGAQMHMDVPFVVRGTTGQHPLALDDRLEGRRIPQLEGIDGLDVVMAVYDRRWCPIRTQPVTVDDRVGGRLGNLDVLGADGSQLVGQPFGGPPTVVGMLRQWRDGGRSLNSFSNSSESTVSSATSFSASPVSRLLCSLRTSIARV